MFNFKKNKNNLNDFKIDKKKFDEIKDKSLIIDVRDIEEYKLLKQIPNSINVPYYKLISDPSKYIDNKEKFIITICNAGNRSTAAAEILREKGYKNTYVLTLGIYGYYH